MEQKTHFTAQCCNDGILMTIEYLRCEFPGEAVGHRRARGHRHLFYVGPTESRARHRLLLGQELLADNLPLSLIVKLRELNVARLLREAGPGFVRPDLR